jgi:hypothetical protein
VRRISAYGDQLLFDDNTVKGLANEQDMVADALCCIDEGGARGGGYMELKYYDKVQLIY